MIPKTQPQPAIFYSIVGFTLIFAWLMSAYYFGNPTAATNPILTNLFTQFVFWKFFTLGCLIYGLWLQSLNHHKLKPILAAHLLILIGVISVSAVIPIFIYAVPIFIFGGMWFVFKKNREKKATLTLKVLAVLTGISVIGVSSSFVAHPFFYQLQPEVFNSPLQNLNLLVADTNLLINILYGFLLVVMGYLMGSNQWLHEYHFLFGALQKMFRYCLLIILLWITLNFFKVYAYFSQWHWGYVFYTLDALAINLVFIYTYLYLLIYLENFKFGKTILRFFEIVGKGWPLQAVVLVFIMAAIPNYNLNFEFGKAVFIAIFGYLTLGLVSRFRHSVTGKHN